jgi:hypothetical protein
MLWGYLTDDLRDMVETGETVLEIVNERRDRSDFHDYSFCVFSFAKAYEGFLKKLLLDMDLIKKHEYYGDDIRIGRILSPYYLHEHTNVFSKMCAHPRGNKDLSQKLWDTWKRGRNLIFHYFPHNFRKISYQDAYDIIKDIIDSMESSVSCCNIPEKEKTSIIHS